MPLNQDNSTDLFQLLKATSRAFRLGMEGQASSNLLSLINLLMEAQQNKPTLFSDEVNRVLSEIFEGQARKDFLWIADMLEYELSPLLRG